VHGGGIRSVDTDDSYFRMRMLQVCRDSRDQAATPNGYKHGIDLASRLTRNLYTDRALARDDIRIIKWMNEDEMPLLGEFE